MVNDTVEDTSGSHLIEDLLIDVSLRKQLAFGKKKNADFVTSDLFITI